MRQIGQKFNMLTIVAIKQVPKKRIIFTVQCECGVIKDVFGSNLGRSVSCGCQTSRLISEATGIHGESNTPAWIVWHSMKQRCENPNHKSWGDYGGRGITVCARWQDYTAFRDDIGQRPPGAQLDRIDNQKGYGPENCKWSTAVQNATNRRTTIFLTFKGETHSLAEWGRKLHISPETLYARRRAGLSVSEILCERVSVRRLTAHHGIEG